MKILKWPKFKLQIFLFQYVIQPLERASSNDLYELALFECSFSFWILKNKRKKRLIKLEIIKITMILSSGWDFLIYKKTWIISIIFYLFEPFLKVKQPSCLNQTSIYLWRNSESLSWKLNAEYIRYFYLFNWILFQNGSVLNRTMIAIRGPDRSTISIVVEIHWY